MKAKLNYWKNQPSLPLMADDYLKIKPYLQAAFISGAIDSYFNNEVMRDRQSMKDAFERWYNKQMEYNI